MTRTTRYVPPRRSDTGTDTTVTDAGAAHHTVCTGTSQRRHVGYAGRCLVVTDLLLSLALHTVGPRRGGWSADPVVLLPAIGTAIVYIRGVERVRMARGRGAVYRRAIAFATGMLVVLAALQSPLEGFAERSLTMHMVQHILLTSVAAPLLLLGRPAQVLALGLRRGVVGTAETRRPRRAAPPAGGRSPGSSKDRATAADEVRVSIASGPAAVLRRFAGLLGSPWATWSVFVAVYLGWHIPVLYDAALDHQALHAVEHGAFVVAALVFWYPVVQGRRRGWRSPPARIVYLVLAMLVVSGLGVGLIVSNGVWYPAYEGADSPFDLTALEDQRLAGAMMWVFDGMIYAGVIAVLFLRWLDVAASDARAVA